MNGNPAQVSGSSISPDSANIKKSPRKILFLIIILIGVGIYALFWLHFLGVYKITDIFQSPPSQLIQKQISPYQKQIDQLDSLMVAINAINEPLNSKVEKETFKISKGSINDYSQVANSSLIRGSTPKIAGSEASKQGPTPQQKPLTPNDQGVNLPHPQGEQGPDIGGVKPI